jgi:hypothetical protein
MHKPVNPDDLVGNVKRIIELEERKN